MHWILNDTAWTFSTDSIIYPAISGNYSVYSFNENCYSDTSEIYIHISTIINKNDLVFEIYPNPFNEYISVKSSKSKINFIEISDATGKYIQVYKPTEDGVIHTRQFSPGLYIFKVRTPESNYTFKSIKY